MGRLNEHLAALMLTVGRRHDDTKVMGLSPTSRPKRLEPDTEPKKKKSTCLTVDWAKDDKKCYI